MIKPQQTKTANAGIASATGGVHQVLINSADHDDRDPAYRINAGAAEPDAKGTRNFTNTNECGENCRKAHRALRLISCHRLDSWRMNLVNR